MARPISPTKKAKAAGFQLTTMLRHHLEEGGGAQMRALVAKLMELAIVDGDMAAMKLIFDRLEGQAKANITLSNDEVNPITFVIANSNDLMAKLRGPREITIEGECTDVSQPL